MLGKYPKPSVTTDIVAVRSAFGELGDDQWREIPNFALEKLLIKRGQWPHEVVGHFPAVLAVRLKH